MGLKKAQGMFLERIVAPLLGAVPQRTRETFLLQFYGLLKIPMLFYVRPSVIEFSKEKCVVRIPLRRRTKNHLNSMYFAALAAGADCAGGLIAMRLIQEKGNQVSLVFKDFHAEFLKRAEGDVYFTCSDGVAIHEFIEKVLKSGERESMPVHITATVPSLLGTEPVAHFTLTLSLKRKS